MGLYEQVSQCILLSLVLALVHSTYHGSRALNSHTDCSCADIVTTLSITYLKVPKSVLCSSLNLQLSDLKSCTMLLAVAENDCINDAVDYVAFKVTGDNHFVVQGQQVEDFATVFSKVLYSSAISSSAATSPAQ